MNLDDRMRSAHQRQLDDITNQTRGATFTPSPTPLIERAAPAIGIALIVLVAFFGARVLVPDGPTSIESVDSADLDAAATPDSPEAGTAGAQVAETTTTTSTVAPSTIPEDPAPPEEDAPDEPSPQEAIPEEPAVSEETLPPDQPTQAETTVPGQQPPRQVAPTGEADDVTEPTSPTTSATPATPVIEIDPGLPSVKCQSGLRAPLERAALQYIGPNVGWNRLDDLVDEQDNEFTFEAWEPGFPDEVTVELTLNAPVDAVAIQVAQDPFTPVSGDIEISTFFDGELIDTFSIPLSGVDGWEVNTFDTTTRIDRFTITRDDEAENIMEVLVCVQ